MVNCRMIKKIKLKLTTLSNVRTVLHGGNRKILLAVRFRRENRIPDLCTFM